jgi:hypothetical protein
LSQVAVAEALRSAAGCRAAATGLRRDAPEQTPVDNGNITIANSTHLRNLAAPAGVHRLVRNNDATRLTHNKYLQGALSPADKEVVNGNPS